MDDDRVPLTHEFLSIMLGVRGSRVTVAIRDLERRGVIEGERGAVTILDREDLEVAANGYYGAAEAEMRRLFGGGCGAT